MGFMERFKAKGRGNGGVATAELSPFDEMVVPHGAGAATPARSTVTLDMQRLRRRKQISIVDHLRGRAFGTGGRLQRIASASALPRRWLRWRCRSIGNKTVPEQQRILGGVVLLGLLGLVLGTVLALSAASRGAEQVAATGQALMQSQRLAKSVTQAFVGSAQAFPEVQRQRPTCWPPTCAACAAARASCAGRCRPSVQDDHRAAAAAGRARRAERQPRAGPAEDLTQVGQALRTINRQSSDLLETAETVSSLKLQQNATPAELAAVGQLVMLTQRIGKSANEFLTDGRREPRGGVPAGQGLELVPRDRRRACSTATPSCACPAPRTRRPASACDAADQAVRRDAHAGRRRSWATCRAWCPRVKRRPAIIDDSEPLRKGLETLQEQLSAQKPASASAT